MKKYALIHTQGNIETAHGYYDNMYSANKVIERIFEQEIETENDSVSVYEINGYKFEADYDTELENLIMNDVACYGKLIRQYGIAVSWYWDEKEVAE